MIRGNSETILVMYCRCMKICISLNIHQCLCHICFTWLGYALKMNLYCINDLWSLSGHNTFRPWLIHYTCMWHCFEETTMYMHFLSFLAATKQLYEWLCPSVPLSVHLSRSHGPKIWRFVSDLSVSRRLLQFEDMDGYEMIHVHIYSRSMEEVYNCFLRSYIRFQGHPAEKSTIWIRIEQDY